MSLKQECIDIIKLIIEPLRHDDYDFYELETGSIRDICEKTGEDITYAVYGARRSPFRFRTAAFR